MAMYDKSMNSPHGDPVVILSLKCAHRNPKHEGTPPVGLMVETSPGPQDF